MLAARMRSVRVSNLEVRRMPFMFKLSKRMAQSWSTRAVFIAAPFLHLSLEQTAALVALSAFCSIRVLTSEFRNRRHPVQRRRPRNEARRMSELTLCREWFRGPFVIQFACFMIPTVGVDGDAAQLAGGFKQGS
jgi:hypothetical protein